MYKAVHWLGVREIGSSPRTGHAQRKGRRLALGLLCAALLLGLGTRPAHAQTGMLQTHARVEILLTRLRNEASRLSNRIQFNNLELTQLQQLPAPTFFNLLMIDRLTNALARQQAELLTVQSALDLVGQLDQDLDVAARLTVRIRVETRLLAQLQSLGLQTLRTQVRIATLQNALQADQAALQALQAEIALLQAQVAQLFG